MAVTRVPSEQLSFRSANTGEHLLDTYLEDAEIAGQRLDQLLGKLFSSVTGEIDAFTFTYDSTSGAEKMNLRIGEGGATNEIASFTQLFIDLNNFKSTALSEMGVKQAAAALSETNALASKNSALAAKGASETAQAASELARDLSQTYANQAFSTTPTTIGENILVAQLFGSLFNGSSLNA